jgi:nucleotide-binding universal stress UspA family protein
VDFAMIKETILCAIDFSKSSRQALQWAMSQARLTQTQVSILFCYRLLASDGEEEFLTMKRAMETKALEQFHEIEKEFPKINKNYQFIIEVGFFPSRIEMFMRKSPVTLLVMGNSVIENFNEYKSFSFEQFLLRAKVPVVVVPGDEDLQRK